MTMTDWEKVVSRIVDFIKKTVEDAKARGVVVGLSGGVDSSTTAFLCVKALGKEKVLGVIMPEKGVTREEDIEDALKVCDILGIDYKYVEINPMVEVFLNELGEGNKIAVANLKPRIRMIINYYYANNLNYLVAGTGNKSELLTGYYTKYGDGGVDFLPIGDLYKTEVFELAKYLGVPERIVKKKPSAGLWIGQTDEGELGITYAKLDTILKALEKGLKPEEISKKFDVSEDEVRKVIELVEKSRHKREMPPIVGLRDLFD
jgi:NAD+ synthase